MSTRSSIILQTNEGYQSIYCHFDGYLSGVGKTLLENYTTREKVTDLIKLGDISSLNNNLKDSVAYGGDFRSNVLLQDVERQEYNYVFTIENEWMVSSTHFENKDFVVFTLEDCENE